MGSVARSAPPFTTVNDTSPPGPAIPVSAGTASAGHGPALAATAAGGTTSSFNHGGNVLITDQFNNRVIVIDTGKHIVFQYGITDVVGSGFNELFAPYTAFVIGDYTGQTVPPALFR
ncbi:MAG: hypothetical protein L3K06_00575 [Thermoplasmata archaeon]|nr:hypothetical protein [Thermoplasmata archaeon]